MTLLAKTAMHSIIPLNKPSDVHYQFTGAAGRATVVGYLDSKGYAPAAALDRESEEQVVLTMAAPCRRSSPIRT